MMVKELIKKLEVAPYNSEVRIVIKKEVYGATPTVGIRWDSGVVTGFDWDSGKVLIHTDTPIVEEKAKQEGE